MNKKLFHDLFKGYNIQFYSWTYTEVVFENKSNTGHYWLKWVEWKRGAERDGGRKNVS